jgi:hypothetical protein
MSLRSAILGAAMIAGLTLAGCRSSPRADEASQADGLLPAEAPLAAAEVFPLRPMSWRYEIVKGDDEGKIITLNRRPTDRFSAQWIDVEGDRRSAFHAVDADGNIVMTASIEHGDRAVTLFEPPMLIVPRVLEPGREYASEFAMRVVDEQTQKKERESGRGARTIRYVGDQIIETPAGKFRAHRLEVHFTADLRMAEAEKYTTILVAADSGTVMESRDEQIRILALASRSLRQQLVLIEKPAP